MDQNEQGWDWIVGFYSKPAVKSACLVFQDRHGIDVTFLLYLCWLDHNQSQPKDHYLTIHQSFEGMRKKINLIRKVRRFASTFSFAANLKKRLLARELDLEKEFFYALSDFETETAENTVLAKNYIAYKGAIPSAAATVFLKLLKT